MDLQERHLPLHRRIACDVADLQDLDEPVQLLDDLLHVLSIHHQRHAADAGRLAMADGHALDIEPPAPEQADRAIEHAGMILHQRNYRMFQVFILLLVLPPLRTFGPRSGNTGLGGEGLRRLQDHIADALVDRHHGENIDLPLDAEIYDHGTVVRVSRLDGLLDLLDPLDRHAAHAVGLGQPGEIGAGKRRAAVALVLEQLLPLAHHAQVAVVDDRHFDVLDSLLHDGRQLLVGHLEAAVAGNGPDGIARMRDGYPQGRWDREAHRAGAAAGDVGAGMMPVYQLRRPHLVLAHIGADAVVAALVEDAGHRRVDIVWHELGGVGPVQVLLLVLVLVLHLPDLRQPLARVARRHLLQHRLEHVARVPDDGDGHAHVLADLRRVNIHVDDSGVRREGGCLAGHAVVEAPADVEEHVALLDGAIDVDPAVHAGHADRERMVFGESADAVQGGDNRDAGPLGQQAQLFHRAGLNDAVAGQDERLLGLHQQLDGLPDLARAALVGRLIARQVQRRVPIRNRARLLGVLGHVNEDRARPAGGSDVERLLEHVGQLLDVLDQIIMLGDRHGDAGNVSLLEGVFAQYGAGDLAGDGDEGRAVHHRVRDGRDEVGRARPAGADADADPAGGAGVAFGGVPCALLVAAQHVAQPVAVVPHGVIERHDRPAR